MAFSHGKNAIVFANGYDVSPYFKSFQVALASDTAETSAFGTTAKTHVAGLRDATLSADGMFDGAAGAIESVLNSAFGSDNPYALWSYMPQGQTVGNIGYGIQGIVHNIQVTTAIGDVGMITCQTVSKVGLERGFVLNSNATAVTSPSVGQYGSVVTLDGANSTTNGGFAYLHVTALTGTSFTLEVWHSSDAVTYTQALVFSSVTTANTVQRVTVASGTTLYKTVKLKFTAVTAVTSVNFSLIYGRY